MARAIVRSVRKSRETAGCCCVCHSQNTKGEHEHQFFHGEKALNRSRSRRRHGLDRCKKPHGCECHGLAYPLGYNFTWLVFRCKLIAAPAKSTQGCYRIQVEQSIEFGLSEPYNPSFDRESEPFIQHRGGRKNHSVFPCLCHGIIAEFLVCYITHTHTHTRTHTHVCTHVCTRRTISHSPADIVAKDD